MPHLRELFTQCVLHVQVTCFGVFTVASELLVSQVGSADGSGLPPVPGG